MNNIFLNQIRELKQKWCNAEIECDNKFVEKKEMRFSNWVIAGIFYFVFHYIPPFSFFLKKAEEKYEKALLRLNEEILKKEIWIKKAGSGNNLLSEDDLLGLRDQIKLNRQEKVKLEDEKRKAKGEKPELRNKIEKIGKIIASNETQYNAGQKIFNDEYVKSIELAELFAEQVKIREQRDALQIYFKAWSILTVIIFASSIYLGNNIPLFKEYFFLPTLSCFALLLIMILLFCVRIVPEKEEWVLGWLGEYFVTWGPGVKILFPFFMRLRPGGAKENMGVQKVVLYLNGERNSKVDFSNGSAPVVAEIFFRFFSLYRAFYLIEDAVGSMVSKMQAGLRGYYGPKKIDDAISERANVDLRSIIRQDATDAYVFQEWGIKIESIAVRDIELPAHIEKQRDKIMEAEKSLEVAEINLKTAEINIEIEEKKGSGVGAFIKQAAESAGITEAEMVAYDVEKRRCHAQEEADILIAGTGGGDAGNIGAIAGATSQLGAKAVNKDKKSSTEEK